MTPITRDPYQEQIQLSPSGGLLHKADSARVLWEKTFFPIKKSILDICNYFHHKRARIYAKFVTYSVEHKYLISSTRDYCGKNLPLKLSLGREA